MLESNEKELERIEQKLSLEINAVSTEIEKCLGPFMKDIKAILDDIKLERAIYHYGSLAGNDINKMTKMHTIGRISNVFKPKQIETPNGQKSFRSEELANKILNLLNRFSSIYNLMTCSRVLCKHEIDYLASACKEYGEWVPVNFPLYHLSRKFHVIVVHVPEKAKLQSTVGLEAEHISESIHSVTNRLEARYSSIHETKQRLQLILKDQWLQSNTSLGKFREPKRRICQKCLKCSHYKKTYEWEE